MNPASKGTPWYEAYPKIALKLHKFYRKHRSRSGESLFQLVNDSLIYRKYNLWLSNTKRISIPSLEPIQLFVSFSRSGQNAEIRTEVINEIIRLLDPSQKGWDKIDFEGCPTPLAIKLQYVRPEHAQNEIWVSFNALMEKGKVALTPLLWEQIKKWRGIQIPSFTIFLFWIKSEEFLPLDKNTRQYLERADIIKTKSTLTLESYLELLNNKKIGQYTKVSLEAYYFNNNPELFESYFGSDTLISNTDRADTRFRLIGIRTIGRNKIAHKILKAYTYYPLDRAIRPATNDTKNEGVLERFQANVLAAETLYDLQNLKINITAIVGKNGSGKSTLLDLLMMGIYNLSIQLGYVDKEESRQLERLNFEIYWHADTLFKLSFGKEILFHSFRQTSKEDGTRVYELINEPVNLEDVKTHFFYSILVNYSHYALNSTDYKVDWITPMSHKNDGYITPLVINPKRTKGDIDINNQKDLLNMRLLLNLLELHDADIPRQSFRYIDNGKYLKYFSVFYDKKKQKGKIRELKKRVYDDTRIISLFFEQVTDVFDLDAKSISHIPFIESIRHYLFNKMLTIVERYGKYKTEYKSGLNFLIEQNAARTVEISEFQLRISLTDAISALLKDLNRDTSHITLKFKQAINYLKYPKLRKILNDSIDTRSVIELDKYQKIVNDIINSSEENLNVAELLPPAIFKLDFHIDDLDRSSFNTASSGEYQLVSVLSSVLYHIRNIDSVKQGNRYRYVTMLLDEIELYFHPNMQRFFIKKLLESLSKLDNDLYGIHILFSTHSPFILSDIQQEKILKLKNGEMMQRENGHNTFAANIHDLLADEFFLDEGYMGAFAQKEIETAINTLNYLKADIELKQIQVGSQKISTMEVRMLKRKLESERNMHLQKLLSQRSWEDEDDIENWDIEYVKRRVWNLIEITGEPLIKDRLSNMYRDTFKDVTHINTESRDIVKQTILRMMRENNISNEDLG